MYTFQPVLPDVLDDAAEIKYFFSVPSVANDLEWNKDNHPTWLSLSDGLKTLAVPFREAAGLFKQLLANPSITISGHNFCGADLIILEKMGLTIPLDRIDDSIIWHYLVNCHLCKGTGKTTEEGDDKRGRGWMNLGAMASIYTNLPYWKECRGVMCTPDLPCPEHNERVYNGIDSLAVALALPPLKRQARLRGVSHLYPMHRELMYVLAQMREYGVKVDRKYVQELNSDLLAEKEEIEKNLPFNPRSPKAVVDYFKSTHKLSLPDAQEDTLREMVEDMEDEAPTELVSLLDLKELGNGAERWFKEQYRDKKGWLQGYLDENDFVHPRLGIFTSYGRMQCTAPNLQNAGKRRRSRKKCECGCLLFEHSLKWMDGEKERWACVRCGCRNRTPEYLGKRVRRAIIAPEGWYILRADYSNAENRVVLHFSGYEIARDVDLHTWVGEMSGLTEDMSIVKKEGSIRAAAKTIQHGGNILEGLQLKSVDELRSKRIRSEVAAGARIVFPEWTFNKQIVTFTGVNLADRVFGDKSWESRAKALAIANKYFERFPGVRDFQKRVSRQCEVEGAVRPPHGYCMLSYGDAEKRMKTAQAAWQAQPVGHIMKLAILNSWRRWKAESMMRPVLSVHDEMVLYVRNEMPPDIASRKLQEDMEIETPEMPGFTIPAETSHGANWRDQNRC